MPSPVLEILDIITFHTKHSIFMYEEVFHKSI